MIWHLILKPLVMPLVRWWRRSQAERQWWADYEAGRLEESEDDHWRQWR